MPAVLVTRGVPERVRRHLAERCRLEVWEGEGVMPRAELLDRVAGKAGLVAMLTDRVDGELLDRAGRQLRVVANYAVGHDNLDLEACTARGVLATNTPDVVTEATADLAWALLLAAALVAGQLGAAGLDVFEREPEVHPGLLGLDNVTIVPHLGTATVETRVAMGMAAAANLLAALEGRRPPNLLNPDALGQAAG